MPCRTLLIVWLGGDGHGVALRVVGYQFPDADAPAQRFSWHMLEGSATCVDGSWQFRYPALTCDESPRVGGWLRNVAAGCVMAVAVGDSGSSAELAFTEPNLSLAAFPSGRATAMLDIGLALEFAPPWWSGHGADAPYVIRCEMNREQLMQAAADWEAEIGPYPDR
ncbi:WapI family immunity protein [Dactylosporangium sp. McL0621]|uniref:WapI family immunity protein n=1 Tax=Dactylosporangium sp. McL0621 TaxID=3415678 RepID=UPI003CED929B